MLKIGNLLKTNPLSQAKLLSSHHKKRLSEAHLVRPAAGLTADRLQAADPYSNIDAILKHIRPVLFGCLLPRDHKAISRSIQDNLHEADWENNLFSQAPW